MSTIKRYAKIIAVRPGMLDRYIELHRNQSDEIRELLKSAGCVKCDIHILELDGKTYLIQVLEVDEAQVRVDLSRSLAYAEWDRATRACQHSLPGAEHWKALERIYALDRV